MKKTLAMAISLIASSSAFADANDIFSESNDLLGSTTRLPLMVKFTDLSGSNRPYCMYSTVVNTEQCTEELVSCAGNNEYLLSGELATNIKHFDSIKVKNERTGGIVAEGAVVFGYQQDKSRNAETTGGFQVVQKYGLENMNFYQTEEGIEFFLKPTTSAVLYNHEDFLGNQIEVLSDLPDLGRFNAQVDSYTIPEGWTLRFYEGKNFTGTYHTRGEMRMGSIDGADFYPRVQSVRVVKPNESLYELEQEDIANKSVTLFGEENYLGKQVKVLSDIADLEDFNEDMDSYHIPEGWTVRFYQSTNFQGGYFTRGYMRNGTSDKANFGPRIRSMRVVKEGEPLDILQQEDRGDFYQADTRGYISIYSEENHEGNVLEIRNGLADLGELNQNVHSYSIPEGWTIRFYQGKNFTGTYYTRGEMRHGTFDAADYNYSNVQSVRILHKGEPTTVFDQEDDNN